MRKDAAFEEGRELVLDELRQVDVSLSRGLLDERRRVLLHQAVHRDLFRALALLVERRAIRRPLGLLRRGLHDWLPLG